MERQIMHIGKWHLEPQAKVSVGDFNSVSDIEKYGVFPGKYEGDSAYTIVTDDAKPLNKIPYVPDDYLCTVVSDSGYFYGITKEKTEIIAVMEDNCLIPVSGGAGGFVFEKEGKKVFETKAVTDYTVDDSGKYTVVTVNYSAEGEYGYLMKLSNTYTFRERSFTVDAEIECMDLPDGIDKYYFAKNYLNDYSSYTKRVSMRWEYPENDDFAFKMFDGLVVAERYGDYALYSNIMDENCDGKVIIRDVDPKALLLCPEFSKDFTYKYHIEYAVVKTDEK